MSKRKNHAPAFKAKAPLAALSGEKTITEPSSEFGVHQTLIHKWVRQLKESAVGVFAGEIKTEDAKREKEPHALHAKIGQLTVTMDTDFCVSAQEEALAKHGSPDIFNTDQGSQFTGFAFTSVLLENGIRISMDGRGRWLDNVFIERLWRSLKYENVYLSAYETGSEARTGIGKWIAFYNQTRPHSALGGITPNLCYEQNLLKAA